MRSLNNNNPTYFNLAVSILDFSIYFFKYLSAFILSHLSQQHTSFKTNISYFCKMNLSTPVNINKSEIEIQPHSTILTIGSCFSEHMGDKLLDHRFNCTSNPFSTVFNPLSIGSLLTKCIQNKQVNINEIEEHAGRFFHYDFHTSYDATDRESVLININKTIAEIHKRLESIDLVIVTFGTSIAYRHIEQDRLVANCHKVPNHQFRRQFINDDLMYQSIYSAVELLKSIRPSLHIIFTVSPVRHTKEGLVDNNRSKSKLIGLSHKLVDNIDHSSYFPSYEVMMDELRDYRFYKEDMIHPSSQAVDIIWNRFIETYFSEAAVEKVKDFSKLNQAMNHRPFDSDSEAHKKFIENQMMAISSLKAKYSEVNFSDYVAFFQI